jgi:hypothetical protein
MSDLAPGYEDWRTAYNPADDYDEDAVLENIKESVEDDNPEWTEEQVAKEVKRRFYEYGE